MVDEELALRGLNALLLACALLLQDAHEAAVKRLPKAAGERRAAVSRLSDAVRKAGVLAAACDVLVDLSGGEELT